MSHFLAEAKIEIKNMISYKFEVLIWGILLPIIFAVDYFLWTSIYGFAGQEVINGFTLNGILIYYALALMLSILTYTEIDQEISHRVRDGRLAVSLIRPGNWFLRQLYRKIGAMSFVFVGQASVLIALTVFFLKAQIFSAPHFILFIVSAFLAMVLSFTFAFLMGLSSFWLTKYGGLSMFRMSVAYFLGGSVIPISFLPEFWQRVSEFLPFQYLAYGPIQIFLGQISVIDSLQTIAIQAIWIIALLVLIKIGWEKALKQFSAVGQ